MEDFSKEKIQKKASKILRNSKINVLKDEKEIVEILNKILNENDEIVDYILLDKVLNNIDMYIKTKEKMALAEEDYIFF